MTKDLAILTVLLSSLAFFLGLPWLAFAILVFLAYMVANDIEFLNKENIQLSQYNSDLHRQLMLVKYGEEYRRHYRYSKG